MRTRTLIILKFIFYFIIIGSCYAQEKLYFLKATPVEDPFGFYNKLLDNDWEIPASLLLYNKDSMKLTEIQNLASYEYRVKDVRYYYDSRRIVIIKQNRLQEKELYMLHTDKLDSFIYKRPICPIPYTYLGYKLLQKDSSQFLCLECFDNDDFLKGINIKNYQETEFLPIDYKQVILSGASYYTQRDDYQNVYTEPSNGNLRLPVVAVSIDELYKRPIFPLTLPDSLQIGKKEMLNIVINNKNQFVFYVNSTDYTEKYIGSTNLIIYDYSSQKWYRRQIKGNMRYLNNFGNWLAGVVYDWVGMNPNNNRESPGMEERRKINSKNEYNADVRFADLHIYSPGILYLFNTYTQKYIEWATGQGDSQILLVEGNEVYYRVNDEIYKTLILEGEKLSKPILLIQCPQVVDIHWAFIIKKT